ncbi:ABC transporter ATP-binding protein [Aneurinibacillus aneurinilyticus]|uniref:ABC transporter ATP-binding protein n=1 Tax=Aneurinibacillus aneurinilyticus TaxID=1391 RepID=UPI002E1D4FCE|nr:ABC transporter ATP-binding protein [Aneurinibacillus aneurinilyticus]
MDQITNVMFSLFYAFKTVAKYAKKNLLYSIFINILLGISPLITIWLTKELINKITLLAEGKIALKEPLIFLVLQMLILLANYFIEILSKINEQKLNNIIGLKIKKKIFLKVKRLPYITFENPKFYDRFERVTNSPTQILAIVRDTLNFGSKIIMVVSLILFLISTYWPLVLIMLFCTGFTIIIELQFGQKRYQLVRYLTPHGRKEAYISDLLKRRDTLKELRLLDLSEYFVDKWSDLYKLNSNENLKMLKKYSIWDYISRILLTTAYVSSGVFLIVLISAKRISIGEFVATLQAVQNLQVGLSTGAQFISKFYEGSLYIKEFRRFMEEEEMQINDKDIFIDKISSIGINNLTFCYPNQHKNSINGLTFKIEQGQKVAIVGENGAGKSTFIKCMTGLYKTGKGMIEVNGYPLELCNIKSYQDRLAVLFQDYIKYEFTLTENIGFGRILNLDKENKIKEAAEKTGINRFSNLLPYGYNSLLGRLFDGGNELSEGQWQKVALSRMLFRDADLIILDEPTSALDPKSEVEVIENLFDLASDKSVVFITHRLGAACLADFIIVIKQGNVIEQGTHSQLLDLNGEYKKLYEAQARWYNTESKVTD